MLKIALYGRLKDQKIIRDALTSPLMEKRLPTQGIYYKKVQN